MKSVLFVSMPFILLAGCTASTVMKTFDFVKPAKPMDLSFDCTPKSLEFKQCIITASTPLKIGNLYNNDTKRSYTNEIILLSEQLPFLKETAKKCFYDILKDDGYSLLGAPDDLFGDISNDRPELIVGAKIIEVGQNRIISDDRFWSGRYISRQLQSYIKINWQVFSPTKRGIVFETTTEGYSEFDDSFTCYSFDTEVAAYPKALGRAIYQATENLSRNPKFHDLTCSSQIYNGPETGRIEVYIDTLLSR